MRKFRISEASFESDLWSSNLNLVIRLKFKLKADIIDKNGYNVPVFEVRVSKDLILFDQNKDLITQEKQTVSVDGVNGPDIVLGSLSDVSTNGNWPTTFDFERK